MNIARTPWDNEAELGRCVRNAPGNVARRPRVDGLADHDMASTLRQTMPATLGARTPVKLDGPPQDAPTRCATATSSPRGVPSGALPVRGIAAGTAQTVSDLGWRIDSPVPLSSRRVLRDRSRPNDEHQSETNERKLIGKGSKEKSAYFTICLPLGHSAPAHLPSSGRAKTNRVFPRCAFRSQGAPSPANPAVQPPQPTQTAMYCRPSRL